MLLLLAALLLAAPDTAAQTDDADAEETTSTADAEPEHDDAESKPEHEDAEAADADAAEPEHAASERAAEAAFTVAAGTRGERRIELSAKTSKAGLSFSLGAVESGGPQADQRQELVAGFQAGPLHVEGRFVPWSSGLLRAAGEVGVHFEPVGLILGARTAKFGRYQLQGGGARLELESSSGETLHAGLTGSIWVLSLDAPKTGDAWNSYAKSTLDWAQRWETSAWASKDIGAVALVPAFSISQPPQPGALEARASLGVELQLGQTKLRVEGGTAKLWPQEQWLFDLSAGMTMALY
jgi:hypothetical protein